MSRHSVHAVGCWIMDLAAQPHVSVWPGVVGRVAQVTELSTTSFCRCDSRTRFWAEPRIAHSQRHEDVLSSELVKRHPADTPHNFPECDVVNIAVNKTSIWRSAKGFFD